MTSIAQAFKNNFVFNNQASLQSLSSGNLIDGNLYYYLSGNVVETALWRASATDAVNSDIFAPNDITPPAPGRFFRQRKGYIENLGELKNEIKQLLVYDSQSDLLATSAGLIDAQVYFFLSNTRETINQAVWKASSLATPDGIDILLPSDLTTASPGRFFVTRTGGVQEEEFASVFKQKLIFNTQGTLLSVASSNWVNNAIYYYLNGNEVKMVLWKASALDAISSTILRPNDLSPSEAGRFFVQEPSIVGESLVSRNSLNSNAVTQYNTLDDILDIPAEELVDKGIYYFVDTGGRLASLTWDTSDKGIHLPSAGKYLPNTLPLGRFFPKVNQFPANYTDTGPGTGNELGISGSSLVDGGFYYTRRPGGLLTVWDATSTATPDGINVFLYFGQSVTEDGRFIAQSYGTDNIVRSFTNQASILGTASSNLVDQRLYYFDTGTGFNVYLWDSNSTATADNITIFEADNSTTGRFIKLPSPTIPIPTLSTVLAIPTNDLVDGQYYYYRDLGRIYALLWNANSSQSSGILKPNDMIDGRFSLNLNKPESLSAVDITNSNLLLNNGFFIENRNQNGNRTPQTFALWNATTSYPDQSSETGYYYERASGNNAFRVAIDPNFSSVYMPLNTESRSSLLTPYHRFKYSPIPSLQTIVFDDFTQYVKYPYKAEGGTDALRRYNKYNGNPVLEIGNADNVGNASNVTFALERLAPSNSFEVFALSSSTGLSVTTDQQFGTVAKDRSPIFEVTASVHFDRYCDWAIGVRDKDNVNITPESSALCIMKRRSVSETTIYLGYTDTVNGFTTIDTELSVGNFSSNLDAISQDKQYFDFTMLVRFTGATSAEVIIKDSGGNESEVIQIFNMVLPSRLSIFCRTDFLLYTATDNNDYRGLGVIRLFYYLLMAERGINYLVPTFNELYNQT